MSQAQINLRPVDQLILDMHNRGSQPNDIAVKVNSTAGNVRRRLRDLGADIQEVRGGRPASSSIWELSDTERRIAFARKASKGAKRTLGKRDVMTIPSSLRLATPAPAHDALLPEAMPTWKRIIFETAIKHRLNPTEMLSAQRSQPIVYARQEAMWRMKRETTMSSPQIAARLNRADHTTVLYGVKRHQARLDAEAEASIETD